jgi:hypothetical protein
MGEQARRRRIAEQQRGDLLQDVADPARAEALPPFDAGDRQRITGDDGDAEVGAEHLRQRADDDPATAAGVQRDVGRAGDARNVVVLDHEDVGVAGQQRA